MSTEDIVLSDKETLINQLCGLLEEHSDICHSVYVWEASHSCTLTYKMYVNSTAFWIENNMLEFRLGNNTDDFHRISLSKDQAKRLKEAIENNTNYFCEREENKIARKAVNLILSKGD